MVDPVANAYEEWLVRRSPMYEVIVHKIFAETLFLKAYLGHWPIRHVGHRHQRHPGLVP